MDRVCRDRTIRLNTRLEDSTGKSPILVYLNTEGAEKFKKRGDAFLATIE